MRVAAQAANDRREGAEADGGRDEHVPENEEDLAEIRQVLLARIMLQVRVGEERDAPC